MFTPAELDLLCCPSCRSGSLDVDLSVVEDGKVFEADLRCPQCGEKYPVQAGVPRLVPEARLRSDEWARWRGHLDGLQERRRRRQEEPNWLLHQIARRRQHKGVMRPFSDFIGPLEGRVLDVGCGPGNLRHRLHARSYYGLDPIVLEQAEGFPLVHGVAEYLPFKSGTFAAVVVVASLDHFGEPDRFFEEAVRLLEPGGKFHLAQQIHETRTPLAIVKHLAHEAKDWLEDRWTKSADEEAPKHISEYSGNALVESLDRYFEVAARFEYSADWYSPNTLFLSLSPR